MYSIMSFTNGNDATSCKGLANINAGDRFAQTPLHLAAKVNNAAMVRFLLDKGANVHAIATKNRSVLHFLLEENEIKANYSVVSILNLLLESGASVAGIDSNSNTLLHLASKNVVKMNLREVITTLLPLVPQHLHVMSNMSGNTYLHLLLQAIKEHENNFVDLVELIVKKNPALISITNKELRTPLHIAAENNLVRCVKILLSN